ncbi:zinc finger CCCH domain-containing protein 13 isoform X2 [Cheilinus undulatus]|uniref:zinc finger CCCH domain-containing protein 13 isoform X2 n=1 Tax=Cheilinus undulatus TaxID=241271 RepID=UPI001BD4C9D2|nr:zinc finger CCCH domain-containing protein 13 isoform X2 [Cheilinus undulatus]
MGTKRPSGNLFDTLSKINTSDCKLQPGGKVSRDPSPRPAMTAQSDRDRDREGDWKRERDMEKMRDKARYKDADPRDRYYERDQAPVPRQREREGERDRRERERRQDDDMRGRGRPLSNLEKESEKEVERGMKKGDTFPRTRKSSPEGGRRMTSASEMKDRVERRPRERPKRPEGDNWERAWERERYREREREDFRNRAREEGRRPVEGDKPRPRERFQEPDAGFQDRRREGDTYERRERDGGRRREKPRPDMEKRDARRPSPSRRMDRDIYNDRKGRETAQKEGKRDTRSEGDSDERERRRERVRDREREELTYQQSRSEGDNKGRTERGRYEDEDRNRYRDREADQSRRRKVEKERERYRETEKERERWMEDRYREYDQRRSRDTKEREADPGKRNRAQNDTAPRPPPRAQSSGEWSSDMDSSEVRHRRGRDSYEESGRGGEDERKSERSRGEATEQRRMWLEPQRSKNSKEELVDRERERRMEWEKEGQRAKEEPDKRHRGRDEYSREKKRESEGVSIDREEVEEFWREGDKAGKERLSDSDGGIEGSWRRRDAEGENVTDNTEESDREEEGGSDYWPRSEGSEEGGSETGWKLDRDRMLSGEDGFVTVSSGEDDREEEEFEDCQEFWESGRSYDEHSPVAFKGEEREETDDGGKEKQPKYVFCVIGQTLPRTQKRDMSPSQVDEKEGVERREPSFKSSHRFSDDNTQQPQDDLGRSDRIASETSDNGQRVSSETGGVTKGKVEHPYEEIGTFKRDSQTERLLIEWREKNKGENRGNESNSPLPSNPYADVFSQVDFEQIQPILDGIKSGAMSPEEVEAIRIRMSGAWSMSEEPKRHSQAPHLKWAKNVVREILGRSEDQALEEPIADVKEEEVEEEMSVLRSDQEHSEPEQEEEVEEELLEEEGLRDDDEDDRSKSWGEVELRNVLDTIDRRKRNSRFFNAAQLYQQYSEAAQNFEILRQARSSDVISVCEDAPRSPIPSPPPARRPLPPLPTVRHPHSLSHTGSVTSAKSLPLPEPPRRSSSPRLSISLTQSATLWRELPGVRNSTELEELTEDQRRLQEVRFEMVTSEASYCRSLDIVVEHFVKCKQLGALLTTQDRNWLFSRLADVRAISHSFLSKLEERVESNIMHFTVCDIIARHCQRFKMVYVPYLTNQSYQDATYQRLMNENQGFKRIVEKLERSPVCQRLPLRSFLVLPFQRITRIKLLVQNIVKRTTPGTPEATHAIKAMKLLEKLIQESNDSITQMKSIESLVSLSAKVDFECRTLPLISQSRRLVREGPVTELMDFSLKDTERSIYLHLFTDYLLVSIQKEGGRFTVIDHAPVSELRAENCRVKLHSLQKNLIRLHMSNKALLLRTDTQSDKLRWISALSRPHSEVDFSAAQDFPQMQCIRAFVAQQPDELSLEKADVILVHQQSSDHWVEGTRLSDRHRGWVPESHLDTISNSRVRQRNLSDALKLTTATAAI